MKCDLNCPVESAPCCKNCVTARKYFVTPENKHLWGENGFLGKNGCGLSRKKMPAECVEYDCKKYLHFIERKWENGKWADFKGAIDGQVACPLCRKQFNLRITH